MQQDGRSLTIVDRHFKEFRIESHDFEREVSRGISIAMAHISVHPIVRAAKRREVFQDESFAGKAALLNEVDRALHLGTLIRFQAVGSNQQRRVPNDQDQESRGHHPHDPAKKGPSLWLFSRWGFVSRRWRIVRKNKWLAATATHFVVAAVDQAAFAALSSLRMENWRGVVAHRGEAVARRIEVSQAKTLYRNALAALEKLTVAGFSLELAFVDHD